MSIAKKSSKSSIDRGLNTSVALDQSNHNLNNSSSKQKFSFPKASRFDLSKSICDSYYDVPSSRSGRATSFGYGHKDMGIRSSRYAPQPCTYNIESQFQRSIKSKRGTSFGVGREEMQTGGPLRDSIARKFIPGPGNYDSAYKTLENRNITLKPRLPDRSQNHLLKNPGPGAYQPEQIGTARYYATSKHPNRTNLAKISPSSGHKDLNMHKTIDLGPGQCNLFSLSRQSDIKSHKRRRKISFINNKKFKDKTVCEEPEIIDRIQALAADSRSHPIVNIAQSSRQFTQFGPV